MTTKHARTLLQTYRTLCLSLLPGNTENQPLFRNSPHMKDREKCREAYNTTFAKVQKDSGSRSRLARFQPTTGNRKQRMSVLLLFLRT